MQHSDIPPFYDEKLALILLHDSWLPASSSSIVLTLSVTQTFSGIIKDVMRRVLVKVHVSEGEGCADDDAYRTTQRSHRLEAPKKSAAAAARAAATHVHH